MSIKALEAGVVFFWTFFMCFLQFVVISFWFPEMFALLPFLSELGFLDVVLCACAGVLMSHAWEAGGSGSSYILWYQSPVSPVPVPVPDCTSNSECAGGNPLVTFILLKRDP